MIRDPKMSDPKPGLETEFSLLSQRFLAFEEDVEEKFESFGQQIDGLRREVRDWMRDKQPHYYRYATVAIAIVGAVWWAIAAQIDRGNQTTKDQNALTREIATANQGDLKQLQNIVTDIAKNVTADHASRLAVEAEIETQFDADSQLRNVQWASMQRRLNDLQNTFADMGAKWPHVNGNPYVEPNISNRAQPTRQ